MELDFIRLFNKNTVKEYCKLNSKDYNFCPKCGEKLYRKTETLKME